MKVVSPPAGSGQSAVFSYLYFHNDALGTPHALTDKAGQIVWSDNDDEFGAAQIASTGGTSSTSSVVCNLRFPGQYFDAETGLHYNFHRYYDPALGRYITEDPIRDGLNWYAYEGSNPGNMVDPLGLASFASLDIRKGLNDWSAGGGEARRLFGNLASTVVDTLGGEIVENLSGKSGCHAGKGNYVRALLYGGSTVAVIGLEAYSFGGASSAIKNVGGWIKNPYLYEVGSVVVPRATHSTIASLSQVEKGAFLLKEYGGLWGVLKHVRTSSWKDGVEVLKYGPTFGGLLGVPYAAKAMEWSTERWGKAVTIMEGDDCDCR